MAEAFYHGKTASAYWNTAALTSVTGWSCTLNADVAETTAMTATNFGKTREVGFNSGTASVTCLLTGDYEVDEGASYVLELLRGAATALGGYAGTATCIGVTPGANKDGVETVTYNFEWDGAVSNTVTEGTA